MPALSQKQYSIKDVLRESLLAPLDGELLLAFLLKRNREYILTHPESLISQKLYKDFRALEKKRLANWPLAYLIGYKAFYGRDFVVSPAVLTPRPETEMIVEEIISLVSRDPRQTADIIDIGTGSGAIIISVAAELRCYRPHVFAHASFRAVDISARALNVARRNTNKYKLDQRISFYHGNLLEPLNLGHSRDVQQKSQANNLIISANLPYLTKKQITVSPSISREPELALDGGPDGLKYYRELFHQFKKISQNRDKFCLLCEIDPSQRINMLKLAKKYLPDAKIKIKKDLAGRYRMAKIFK